MKFVITSDLHLTDRPRDEYRWRFIEWLVVFLAERKDPTPLFVLGDLTDAKDKHSARLVNRTFNALLELMDACRASVYVLKGNHDYVEPNCPFFGFLDYGPEGINFVPDPKTITIGSTKIVFVPHGHPLKWGRDTTITFAHHTVKGARLSSSYVCDTGEKLPSRSTGTTIVSGDVHIPQDVGDLVYVGAPYPINFGDSYRPRILIYNTKTRKLITHPVPSIRKKKLTIDRPKDLEDSLKEGDQAKIVVRLARRDFADWDSIRTATLKTARELGVEVFGIELKEKKRERLSLDDAPRPTPRKSPSLLLKEYAEARNLPDSIRDVGLEVLG